MKEIRVFLKQYKNKLANLNLIALNYTSRSLLIISEIVLQVEDLYEIINLIKHLWQLEIFRLSNATLFT